MADFHFLRPWWLAALPIGIWLIWRLFWAEPGRKSGWRAVVDEALQPHVLGRVEALVNRRWPMLVALAAWLATIAIVPATLDAATVRGLINEGNQAFRSEEYGRALEAYDEALERDPESPYASFNRANALYRSGQFAEAADGYGEAVRQSLEQSLPQLEAAGLHNLGNALYRRAEEVATGNPRQAIEFLVPAARSYLDALRTDPQRKDSAQNLELTRHRIQQLRDQARQQAGTQGSRNQDESSSESDDPSEALRQAAEEQQELAEKSEQLESDRQQRRDSDSREEQRQRAQDLAQRQEDLRERTEQLGQDTSPRSRERVQEAAGHQDRAQQELGQDRPGSASQSQQAAAEALREAAAQAGGVQEEQPEQAETEASEFAEGAASHQAEAQQAMTMDQILAKEQQDRRRRQLLQAIGRVAVDKDW